MPKLVLFGAGNIGRSFIAQLFSRAGYETVFIDVRLPIIEALNRYNRYRVEIRDRHPETIWVENVRGVSTTDHLQIAQEVAEADTIATAVGPDNLVDIYSDIAQGLVLRRKNYPHKTIDIIICENLRNAAQHFRAGLKKLLPQDFPEELVPGLIETSIGKMVPLITHDTEAEDPLVVYAEAYNTLILDGKAFKGPIPQVPGLDPKNNMKAYVDRKLFIHNLGHSMTAYLGYITNRGYYYIWEAIADRDVQDAVRSAMYESGNALIAEYPNEFTPANQQEHIEDLISRFGNAALGDTIYRVGRDLQRKLAPEDRLIGALRLEQKYNLPFSHALLGIATALLFRKEDETGKLFPRDDEFIKTVYPSGIPSVLQKISGFNPSLDSYLIKTIEQLHNKLSYLSNKQPGKQGIFHAVLS
ncbi:MAG: mannitol-1-phosphate 5-dehydrogenase [Patescibacteria group bacterium]|nr:mannitol-1-phosphate 5-dehydrogenase [Patescibacteria group bacterium]